MPNPKARTALPSTITEYLYIGTKRSQKEKRREKNLPSAAAPSASPKVCIPPKDTKPIGRRYTQASHADF